MPLQKNLDEFNFSITSGCRKLLIFRISSGTLYILSHFFFTNSTELHALQTIIVLNYFQLAVKSLFIATPTRMTLTSPCLTDIYLKPLNARGGRFCGLTQTVTLILTHSGKKSFCFLYARQSQSYSRQINPN